MGNQHPLVPGEKPQIPAISLCRSLQFSFQTTVGGEQTGVFLSTFLLLPLVLHPTPPEFRHTITVIYFFVINCFLFLLYPRRLRLSGKGPDAAVNNLHRAEVQDEKGTARAEEGPGQG